MQLFSADAKLFPIFFLKSFFDHKKLKKPHPKVAQKYPKKISALYCQTGQKEEFRFQNVA